MTPLDARRCSERGSGAGLDIQAEFEPIDAGLGTFASTFNRCNARGCWRCASHTASVSMSFSEIETDGIAISCALQDQEIASRDTATAEWRSPGSTDEDVRCTAFTICCAPSVPVHPGCDIRLVLITMPRRVPLRDVAGSEKLKFRPDRFFVAEVPESCRIPR